MKLLDGPSCETGRGSPSDSAPFERWVHAKDQAVSRIVGVDRPIETFPDWRSERGELSMLGI
jgi:hypothetical protein